MNVKKITLLFLSLCSVFVACGGSNARKPPVAGVDSELQYCLKLASQKKYQETIDCLEAFRSRHPGSEQASEAEILIADSYFRQKDFLLAAEAYKEFIDKNPTHSKLDYAYYRTGQAYYLANPKRYQRDQQYLDAATKSLAAVVNYFPGSPYARAAADMYKVARTKMAKKVYMTGRFYYKYAEYRACAPRFVDIIQNYPELGFDEKSYYYLASALLKLNETDQARNILAVFEQRFPQSGLMRKIRGKLK